MNRDRFPIGHHLVEQIEKSSGELFKMKDFYSQKGAGKKKIKRERKTKRSKTEENPKDKSNFRARNL